MDANRRRYGLAVILGVSVSLLSAFIFATQIDQQFPDIFLHSRMSLQPWGPELLSHVLYFVLLRICSGFSTNIAHVNMAAVAICTSFVAFKYAIVTRILSRRVSLDLAAVLAVLLCFVHAIPFHRAQLMLGYFTGNIWHNSTAVLQLPFALIEFFCCYRLLRQWDRSTAMLLALSSVLSVLAKPNFFICLAPVYALFVLSGGGWREAKRLLPLIPAGLVLVAEYVTTYGTGDGIAIQPFIVWQKLADVPLPLALLGSLAFPVVYSILFFRSTMKDRRLLFAWAIWLTSLLVYILLVERGPRMYHANFIWQLVPATFILFLCTILTWVHQHVGRNFNILQRGNLICSAVLLLHFLAGIVYVYKILTIDIW